MAVFDYKALDLHGQLTSGIIDADNARGARDKLRAKAFFPVQVLELKTTKSQKQILATFQIANLFSRTRPADVWMMTHNIATLLSSGYPLAGALESIAGMTKKTPLQKTIAHIRQMVIEGSRFADALSRFPQIFPPLYINMVMAGESSGTLDLVLGRLAEIGENQEALKNRIRSALTYPFLMMLFGLATLFFLLSYVIPNITSIFSDMERALPAPTRLLLAFSAWFQGYFWFIVIFSIVLMTTFIWFIHTESGALWLNKLQLKLPYFGSIFRRTAVCRITRTLSSLIENGVTMMTALSIAEGVAGNRVISKAIHDASEDVHKGQSLSRSFAKHNMFPSLSIQMIEIGEQTGKLEQMLAKIADIYEREIEAQILRLTTLLEPIMIIVMGVVIGFIVLSICLPIFEMNQLVV